MNNDIEQLFETTGDLLYRVRIYDHNLTKCDEIVEMDEMYARIESKLKMTDGDVWNERAAASLIRMKSRLLTMMEDLLFTA